MANFTPRWANRNSATALKEIFWAFHGDEIKRDVYIHHVRNAYASLAEITERYPEIELEAPPRMFNVTTFEQLLTQAKDYLEERYGEPKSTIVCGNCKGLFGPVSEEPHGEPTG